MLLDLEPANKYFLAPTISESLFLIGGKNEMNHLANLMVKGDLMMTTGQMNDECILIVTWDDAKCLEMLKQMNELMEKRNAVIIDGEIVDQKND